MNNVLESLRLKLCGNRPFSHNGIDFPNSIQQYKLGRQLGRGGFSKVFHATLSSSPETHVAIKMMIEQNNMLARILNEVDILWSVRGIQYVVELFAFFEDYDFVYIVTEFCSKGELFGYLQRRNVSRHGEETKGTLATLSESEARYVLRQVVTGLMALHGMCIIHRDLKLSNLLITQDFNIKIADFGLALKLDQSITEQPTMCGTPNYISPVSEILCRQPHGKASDVWSLGCLFYTLLSGKSPFDCDVIKTTLERVLRVDYQMLSNISAEARQLIKEMLQKNPSDRIRSELILSHEFFWGSATSLSDLPKDKGNTLEILDARQLKPLKQITKHAVVEIDQNGFVHLEFSGDKYRMSISPNGRHIYFHKLPLPQNWKVAERSNASFQIDRLPSRFLKKYQYACRFVEVVRSKSPKIILQTPMSKCVLMRNVGLPDVESSFKEGFKIHWSLRKGLIEIRHKTRITKATVQSIESVDSTAHVIEQIGVAAKSTIPSQYQLAWNNLLSCYTQCLEVDRQESELENRIYPTILRCGERAHDENTVTPTNRSLLPVPVSPGESVSELSYKKAYSLSNNNNSMLSLQERIGNIPAPSTMDMASKNSPFSEAAFLKNIGWCLQRTNIDVIDEGSQTSGTTEFLILFHDGVKLLIETPSGGSICGSSQGLSESIRKKSSQCIVSYSSPVNPRKSERHVIDKRLPSYVKQKLVHFPSFVKLFQKSDYQL